MTVCGEETSVSQSIHLIHLIHFLPRYLAGENIISCDICNYQIEDTVETD